MTGTNIIQSKAVNEKDIEDDYDYSRKVYRDMISKNEEAIELIMDLARESEHPRVFEVLSNMLKQNSEIADHLMDLHKKKKDILQSTQTPTTMTQNNLYVGSTTDMQKMIHEKIRNKLENE